MDFPAGETVVQLDGAPVGRDSDGNTTRTYPVKATYDNVAVAPTDGNASSSNERVQGQDIVIIGLTIYLPPTATVDAVDRFEVRGATWEVVGEAQQWHQPFTGWEPGMPVSLTRVKG